jgi:hypothetical protein
VIIELVSRMVEEREVWQCTPLSAGSCATDQDLVPVHYAPFLDKFGMEHDFHRPSDNEV